ncbi:MAG: phosphoribosylaminoimidazolesuccinocarboxamide synthase [Oscillospiraceae bacterium]|jgi:phosphoribosylaminoimidazole-succinocarboxamide synthase|nr:phosphoribosylaminoimidazolesuccinocarboxamide synthase [Oscillospiraceae bacterium]
MQKIISGKVRDVFDVDEQQLVIVTTDRISAFDVILPTPIAGKGAALNRISNFWFGLTKDIVPNHLISTDLKDMPTLFSKNASDYEDRTVLVKKLKMLPFEFIIRGYVFGNMWKAYQAGEPFCGQKIEGDYQLAQKLASPIITPSTKAAEGHDVYLPLAALDSALGQELSKNVQAICLALYQRAYDYAARQGILIADTKLEFGLDAQGNLVLADEIFTPDSSRFWDAAAYSVGTAPQSYDKQFVRDWLISNKLDGVEPAPELPAEVAKKTAALYAACAKKITSFS